VEISCRVYRPRDPRKTPLFGLLDSLYDRVKGAWEERFERSYGFWRGLVDEVVARYLDCGIWESGYVVTQSVLSLRHAHAVASDDHATTPPTARARSRGAAHWSTRVGRACARRILDEAAESVD